MQKYYKINIIAPENSSGQNLGDSALNKDLCKNQSNTYPNLETAVSVARDYILKHPGTHYEIIECERVIWTWSALAL